MAKVRWTEARWVKRAQKARAFAKNARTPVRSRMMLDMAEFYERLAKLTRDFKMAGRGPLAPRKRGKVEGSALRPACRCIRGRSLRGLRSGHSKSGALVLRLAM